ncbi:hypothetical protein [Hominifimenecus sp. rT4P-3]|uniref:hypothetical protein n=1 Tax=Hominifimenecus sp. rT4P-3 TaxID=3242979 RepID=UPI003DA2D847
MYFDRKRRKIGWLLLVSVALILGFAAGFLFYGKPARQVQAEAARAIGETIRERARQCFAVEGVYPESLEYLMENYGLRINTADYYVVYEAFADNLPPNVRVAKKEG